MREMKRKRKKKEIRKRRFNNGAVTKVKKHNPGNHTMLVHPCLPTPDDPFPYHQKEETKCSVL